MKKNTNKIIWLALVSALLFALSPLLRNFVSEIYSYKYMFSDLGLYFQWGTELLESGSIANSAYTPLAIMFFALVKLVSVSREFFDSVFAAFVFVALFGGGYVLVKVKQLFKVSFDSFLLTYLAPLIVLGVVLVGRFDIFPAVLTLASLFLLVKNKKVFSYILLAVAALLKIYPLILLPIFLIYEYKQGKRASLAPIALFLLVIALGTVFFIEPLQHMVSMHITRGVEYGSIWSNLGMVTKFFGAETFIYYDTSIFSNDLVSPLSGIVKSASLPITAIALVVLYILFYKKFSLANKAAQLAKYALLALLVWIIFGKVLSPQYVIWLVPLVSLYLVFAKTKYRISVFVTFLLVSLFTSLVFPVFLNEVIDVTPLGFTILSLRSAALIALLILVVKSTYNKNS